MSDIFIVTGQSNTCHQVLWVGIRWVGAMW